MMNSNSHRCAAGRYGGTSESKDDCTDQCSPGHIVTLPTTGSGHTNSFCGGYCSSLSSEFYCNTEFEKMPCPEGLTTECADGVSAPCSVPTCSSPFTPHLFCPTEAT
jgi:hypothetical protein